MSHQFTSDQEARIAEIVGMVMRGLNAAAPSLTPAATPAIGAPRCNLPEEAIVARYKLGENAIQLADEFGVSYETIYRIASAHGIKPGGRPRGPKPKGFEKYPAIAEAYEAGETLLGCSAKFGVGVPVVQRALLAHNVTVRTKGSGAQLVNSGVGGAERIASIMAMRAEGKSLEQIGAVLNVTRERVRQLVVRAGLSDEFAKRPRSAEQLAILREYADGLNLNATAEKLGVSTGMVKKWLIQESIAIRPSPKFPRRNVKTTENAERAAALYRKGLKGREIAETLGLNAPEQIYRLLAMSGVKPTRKPGSGRMASPSSEQQVPA